MDAFCQDLQTRGAGRITGFDFAFIFILPYSLTTVLVYQQQRSPLPFDDL
jgi:hypothetical protein